jgi:hypothetical protein
MAELPVARVRDLEEFAEPLFVLVATWDVHRRVYTSMALYYAAVADELARHGGDAVRIADYRQRAADKTVWAGAVGEVLEPADVLADKVAEALGVEFPAMDGHSTKAWFAVPVVEAGPVTAVRTR